MAENHNVTAACFCGLHSFTALVKKSSLPLKAWICHCYDCRHLSGTLGLSMVDWPSTLIPDLTALSQYAFSPCERTYFCGTCGTHLFWRHSNEKNESNSLGDVSLDITFRVTVGSIDNPDETVQIKYHTCVEDTRDGGWADFLPVINERPLPRWRGVPQDSPRDPGELLPLGWKLQPDGDQERSCYLKAHCHCKGVEFCITRPSIITSANVEEGEEWWRPTGDRFLTGMCVCRSCRLQAGSDVMHWCLVPKANITLMGGFEYTDKAFGTLKSYRSSHEAVRKFCSRCGAAMFYAADDRAGLLNVAVGLFTASTGARAEDWLAWRTYGIGWPEEALHTKLTDALVNGVESWGIAQAQGSYQGLSKEITRDSFYKLVAATKHS